MLHKMKDLRGASAAAIRNAIFKELGLQIPNSRKKLNVINISGWKGSKKVNKCYKRLYDNNKNVIENISKHVFSNISLNNELTFNDIYVYTAAVCDILLNPEYPDLECAKKPLKRHFQKFKVNFFC